MNLTNFKLGKIGTCIHLQHTNTVDIVLVGSELLKKYCVQLSNLVKLVCAYTAYLAGM